MTNIYLVRHGQKQRQAGDPSLTAAGMKQARETGQYLSQFPITRIIASPLKRTVQTAQQIAEVLNLQYDQHDSLRERMNWGDSNLSWEDFEKEWVKTTNDRTYAPEYGISSLVTGQRVEKLITESAKENDHLVLVSHGGAILDYLRNVFGDEKVAILRTMYDSGEDYQIMNCSISKVVVADGITLELLNFTDHLSFVSK